ncbi:unnamed protein product [Callosobruchus maculatus]|uniref:Uncharacterized protein n=1 Tax=Callosobruchus maculatus TaxID=64391 RepID=A0A653CWL6_CALMS|nr:unnamed protein product [Callosobruchus maculatus]
MLPITMSDIVYNDYPIEDRDLATKKYVDSAIASNERDIDLLDEKLSEKAHLVDIIDLDGRLQFIERQLEDLRKKIGHK